MLEILILSYKNNNIRYKPKNPPMVTNPVSPVNSNDYGVAQLASLIPGNAKVTTAIQAMQMDLEKIGRERGNLNTLSYLFLMKYLF